VKGMMVPVVLPEPEVNVTQPVVGKFKEICDNPAEKEGTDMIREGLVSPATKRMTNTMPGQL